MSDEQPSRADGREVHWPVHRYRPGEEPGDDLSGVTTAEERIAMVRILSERMWELTGQPLPNYTRATLPVRLTRLA
jgi:hypothetical protein